MSNSSHVSKDTIPDLLLKSSSCNFAGFHDEGSSFCNILDVDTVECFKFTSTLQRNIPPLSPRFKQFSPCSGFSYHFVDFWAWLCPLCNPFGYVSSHTMQPGHVIEQSLTLITTRNNAEGTDPIISLIGLSKTRKIFHHDSWCVTDIP